MGDASMAAPTPHLGGLRNERPRQMREVRIYSRACLLAVMACIPPTSDSPLLSTATYGPCGYGTAHTWDTLSPAARGVSLGALRRRASQHGHGVQGQIDVASSLDGHWSQRERRELWERACDGSSFTVPPSILDEVTDVAEEGEESEEEEEDEEEEEEEPEGDEDTHSHEEEEDAPDAEEGPEPEEEACLRAGSHVRKYRHFQHPYPVA